MKILVFLLVFVHILLEYGIHTLVIDQSSDKNGDSLAISTLSVFHYFIFSLSLVYYLCASLMNPGYLTKEIVGEMKADASYKEELEDNGEKCYCYLCEMDRPLRCRHCGKCDKCVMVFDHHSNILQNCVGHRNYKCYFGFISLFCVYSFITVALLLMSEISNFSIAVILYLFIVGCLLALKVYYNAILLITNTTESESKKNKLEENIFKRHRKRFINKYNAGNAGGNIRCRFGSNALFWFLPTPNTDRGYIPEVNPLFTPPHEFAFHDNFEDDLFPEADVVRRTSKEVVE